MDRKCDVCGQGVNANHVCLYKEIECRVCSNCYYGARDFDQYYHDAKYGMGKSRILVYHPDVRAVIILYANKHCNIDLLFALLTDTHYLNELRDDLKIKFNELNKRLSSEQLIEIDRRLMLVND